MISSNVLNAMENVSEKILGFLMVAVSIPLSPCVLGQDLDADSLFDDSKRWQAYCNQSIDRFTARASSYDETKFVRLKQPIFIHRDATDANERGLLYLFADDQGRPAAVMTSILMQFDGDTDEWSELVERHILWDRPIEMRRDGRSYWNPTEGLSRTLLPDAPAPRPRLQERQAKLLAKRFTAHGMEDGTKRWNYRLIPKPVHSFHAARDQPIDCGFVFLFCRATDPEVLLVLEARPDGQGASSWHYALASFSGDATFVSLDGEPIWDEARPFRKPGRIHAGGFVRRDFDLAAELDAIENNANQ